MGIRRNEKATVSSVCHPYSCGCFLSVGSCSFPLPMVSRSKQELHVCPHKLCHTKPTNGVPKDIGGILRNNKFQKQNKSLNWLV